MSRLTNFGAFIEIDYSRFDQSINLALIQCVEHVFLTLPFLSDQHQLYREALVLTTHTQGISEFGLTYEVYGTRCSGDAHTSIANGLINCFATWLALHNLPVGTWDSIHEGDDGLIGVDSRYLDAALNNLSILNALGLSAKIDVYNDIGQTSFCGRFNCHGPGGFETYSDINRTLSKFHTICSSGDPASLLLAKAMSYYSTDHNTPLLGPLTYSLIRILKPRVNRRRFERALMHIRTSQFRWNVNLPTYDDVVTLPDISPTIRAAVALRTGYSVSMQLSFEQYYYSWIDLGYIPETIDGIPADWNFTSDSHVTGTVSDWVL